MRHRTIAYDAEAYRPGALYGVVDLRQWPCARVDYIVEKLNTAPGDVAQMVPIDVARASVVRIIELTDIDGAEVARVAGMKKLFTAGVTGADLSHAGHQMIVAIDFIDEGDAWLCILVS